MAAQLAKKLIDCLPGGGPERFELDAVPSAVPKRRVDPSRSNARLAFRQGLAAAPCGGRTPVEAAGDLIHEASADVVVLHRAAEAVRRHEHPGVPRIDVRAPRLVDQSGPPVESTLPGTEHASAEERDADR